MTKETILRQVLDKRFGEIEEDECLEAMSIFAKQEAIEFAKWRILEGWLIDGSGEYYYQPNESTPFLTTEQLYNLFLQSKEKKDNE